MIKITGLALATVLTLSGCGGGGGSESVSTPAAVVPATTSVSGTAAKGIVKQAKVLVCRIVNGAPEPDASCASGTSGNDGAYSVVMSDGYTGPAMVKVMPGTASTMMDETTGTDVPYTMTMRAVVPAVSETTTVYVTPFSEMAASAVSTTTIDATKISQAIAAVESTMLTLGVDMSVMPMVDLKDNGSDSAMLTRQANMVKQLARVAMAAKNSNLLKDANGTACNAAGTTTSQQFACAVAAMAGVMNSYVTADATKAANMLAAMNAQNVIAVRMPIVKADGTIGMEPADMTSSASMQTAMQNAGMTLSAAANTINVVMGGMH
ncbi:MAG: hypothetical protein IH605_00325 [Burkholderiales bacterium]|nr:hypothetical protein [Burkholderiales bacterium]